MDKGNPFIRSFFFIFFFLHLHCSHLRHAIVVTAIAIGDTTVDGEIENRAAATTPFVGVTVEDQVVILEDIATDAATVATIRVINGEDRQTVVVAACLSIRTTIGKRIDAVIEGDTAAIAATKGVPIDAAPSGTTTIVALTRKLSPIITAHEEDDVDTCSSFVVYGKC